MKVYISFDFKTVSGGGNQFLKLLRNNFVSRDIYTDTAKDADVILFNAHHRFEWFSEMRSYYRDKFFVHRMDGLYSLYNNLSDVREGNSLMMNSFANATIFQSNWAMLEYYKKKEFKNAHVIYNSSDSNLFYKEDKKNKKKKIIITSWSKNKNKGFDSYSFIDKNLDFEKYDVIFIGNSPVKFTNIIDIGALNNDKLAGVLRGGDMYLTASRYECCSNSLIEALMCGLPVVAFDSGSNSELVKNAGEMFSNDEELLNKINLVGNNIETYSSKIEVKSMEEVANNYVEVFKNAC